MSIYLITNRSVRNGRIKDDGKERALPTFRIAACELDDEHKTVSYKVLPDANPVGYERVRKAINGNVKPENIAGSAYFFFDLYKQMVAEKDKPSDTLFFIHGFNYSLESSLEHIYQLHELYVKGDSPIEHIVYVSWPTVGHLFGTYWNDQEDAEETGKVLSRLFNKLFGFFLEMFDIHGYERCKHKIHLAAHSMGNQVLEHMLSGISERKLFPLFKEVLLLNSDVRWDIFEKGGAFERLGKIAERTHMYIHRSDDALRISRFTKNLNQRLGFKGPQNRSVLDEETFIVDTTHGETPSSIKEKHIDHWGYLNRVDVIEDIRQVLKGTDEDDIAKREKWSESTNYFYFKD